MNQTTFQEALSAASDAEARGDFAAANTWLLRAHGLGHASKRDHLRAHAALMLLGFRLRRPVQVISQAGLWALALVFDWPGKAAAR